jgi:bacteriocin-like protein
MKKTTKAQKLDRTRVLNANDLQEIIGGATEVLNNPLYQGSGASGNNPLHKG